MIYLFHVRRRGSYSFSGGWVYWSSSYPVFSSFRIVGRLKMVWHALLGHGVEI